MKSTISLDEYLRQSLINFNRIDNEVLSKTCRLRSPMLNQSDINNDSTLESNPLPNSLNNCERKKTKKKNSTIKNSLGNQPFYFVASLTKKPYFCVLKNS